MAIITVTAQENVHPLRGGYFRRKLRRERHASLPRENPLVFYVRRVREVLATHVKLAAFYLYLHRIRRRVERDPAPYTDPALAPIDGEQPDAMLAAGGWRMPPPDRRPDSRASASGAIKSPRIIDTHGTQQTAESLPLSPEGPEIVRWRVSFAGHSSGIPLVQVSPDPLL